MLSLEFWQKLLATEAPPERLWPVVDAARAGLVSDRDPDSWPGLTPPEVARAGRAAPVPLDVNLVESGGLPAHARIEGGPVAAFVLGDATVLEKPLIGIVGTRQASSYGRTAAALFSERLAKSGAVVVSGGAIGIDSVAHTSAMDAGGETVCVLPCGVDVAYPARHRDLFTRVRGTGCLLSPFACGTPEQDHRLIGRNRLLALLCHALVIVEAPAGSGSLSTAEAARALGRSLFVVPGPVSQETFRGSHDLIRAGATLVHEPGHVLDALGLESAQRLSSGTPRLSHEEATVRDALQGVPRSPESIGEETGLDAQTVLTALTSLEIEGVAVRSTEGYALRP